MASRRMSRQKDKKPFEGKGINAVHLPATSSKSVVSRSRDAVSVFHTDEHQFCRLKYQVSRSHNRLSHTHTQNDLISISKSCFAFLEDRNNCVLQSYNRKAFLISLFNCSEDKNHRFDVQGYLSVAVVCIERVLPLPNSQCPQYSQPTIPICRARCQI